MSTAKSTPRGKVQPTQQWAGKDTNRGGAQAYRQKGAGNKAAAASKPAVVENRDPKGINEHVKVQFSDVIAEVGPESNPARSKDCVWINSHACYTCWKNCLYKLNTLLCGVCLACAYGIEFSVYSFPMVWCVTPFIQCLRLNLVGGVRRCIATGANCLIGSVFEAIGEVFWPFRGYKKDPLLPFRANKVTFNSKVKTKTIPKNPNVVGSKGGARISAKVAPTLQKQKPAAAGPGVKSNKRL